MDFEKNLKKVKEEHINNIDQLLLVVNNYKKYMDKNIKGWDENMKNKLSNINQNIDNLIEDFFILVSE